MFKSSKLRLAVWGLESYFKKAAKQVSGLPKKIALFVQDGVAMRKAIRIGGFCALGMGAWLFIAILLTPVLSDYLMQRELLSYEMPAEQMRELEELVGRPLFSQHEKDEGGFMLVHESTPIKMKMEEQLKKLAFELYTKKITARNLDTDAFLIEHQMTWNVKTLQREADVSSAQLEKAEALKLQSWVLKETLSKGFIQHQKLEKMLSILGAGELKPSTRHWMKAAALGMLWKIAPKDETDSDRELFYPKTVWNVLSKTIQTNWVIIFIVNPLVGISICFMGLSVLILLHLGAKKMTQKVVEEGTLQEGKKEALLVRQELTCTVSKSVMHKKQRINSL